jgi:protein involved in polysaccharide export with SLBB domain
VTRGPNPKTRFDITVASVRMLSVRVVGEVARPGTYQVPATGSVLTALYEAGGLSPQAGFRTLEVRRGAQLVGTVDLYDYLLHGIVPSNVPLASGDVIFVPTQGPRIKLVGEVIRPAIYEIKPGESLRDLIVLAGGLTPQASTEAATIARTLPPDQRTATGRERTVVTVDLGRSLTDSAAAPTPLYPGDSVTVFALTGPRRNAVRIAGSVWQPGTYALDPGMRLGDLIRMAGGLRPDAYQGRAQIVRIYPDSTRQLLGVSLAREPGDGSPGDDPALQDWDEVTVYSRTDFLPERYVAVFGAVRKQGIVQFADSMTLRDAILLAGGLRDDAYLSSAEIARVRNTGSGSDTLATIMRVELDSSYLPVPDQYTARPVGRGGVRVVLHPYDNVFVRRQPGWEVQRNVVLTGEVMFPGRYTLLRKDERLSEIIGRAGGLTPQAYPGGIRFFRSLGEAGRIGVDLPRVLRDPRHKDNLVLAVSDSIDIPAFNPTVRVEGAVNSPASVAYVGGAGIGYYLSAAGGFSRLADKGGTFVQQPNGLIQKGKSPEPGAVVVVPSKDPTQKGVDLVSLFSALAQIFASTATVIVVLTKL